MEAYKMEEVKGQLVRFKSCKRGREERAFENKLPKIKSSSPLLVEIVKLLTCIVFS